MPLSAEEIECLELTCAFLSEKEGGAWRIAAGPALEDVHRNVKVPEALITDGERTAAVEVKSLREQEFQSYKVALVWLKEALTPSCGGYFFLCPPADFHVPEDMSTKLRKMVKREIERVAPTLAPGQSGAVRVPRSGRVVPIRPDGPGAIRCAHLDDEVRRVSPRLTGAYLLVDEGNEHSFVTDEAREAFAQTLVAACERVARDESGDATWHEEWELTRAAEDEDDDGEDRDGVWLWCATTARDLQAAAAEAVALAVEAGASKFQNRSWGERHVLVLDNKGGTLLPLEKVRRAIAAIDDEELRGLDLVLHVGAGTVVPLWDAGDGERRRRTQAAHFDN